MTIDSQPASGEVKVEMADLAAASDPRAVTRQLRQHPVVRIGDAFTLITQRRDVEAALRSPAVFSSGAEAVALGNIRPLIPLQIDPPKHVKYRRVLDPLFAPRAVAGLEGEVADLVGSLVDAFVSSGSCDLHNDFSVPLPCTVFLRLMGLPQGDLAEFLSMKDGIIRPPGETAEEQAAVRRETAGRIYDYFLTTLSQRRGSPGQDLLSRIAVAEVDGERLSDEEVLDVCFLFIIAGLDTVTDSLDCIFGYLAQHPEHRQQLVDDPSLVSSSVEELLRWESPVPTVARVARQDTEVGGCPVQSGEQVMLLLASANTDEEAIAGLDQVDLARDPNPHLAFGGGVHRCLGSHLARLELRVAVRQFHTRIPEYRLAPGAVLEYTSGLRSLHQLPLVFGVGD